MAHKQNGDTFAAILTVFGVGSLRLINAELAANRLSLAVLEHHAGDQEKPEDLGALKSLEQIEAIRPSSWDAFSYVSNLSHLVYATSLFDTFLTDTTQFLLMLFPSSIGKEFRITIGEVIEKESRSDLLAAAAARKARELSYASFLERLADFRQRFGLALNLSDDDTEPLEHFSTLRNVAVHDQGFLTFSLTESGEVQFEQRTCSLHPTQVTVHDSRAATHTYGRIVRKLATLILLQILKEPDHEFANRLIDSLPDGLLPPLHDPEQPA